MEVHHHSHHGKKKWTEYFWEFLMLFLAVTLGFFVENQREHFVEQTRAKQFAASLFEDLRADTAEIHSCYEYIDRFKTEHDILINEFNKPRMLQNDSILQELGASSIFIFNLFDPQIGTYDQVKNSGSLRYFNQTLTKKMTRYEASTKRLMLKKEEFTNFLTNVITPFCTKLRNAKFINSIRNNSHFTESAFIIEPSAETLNQWHNYIELFWYHQFQNKFSMEEHEKIALEIMDLLKKEYHLK
jgi:hypothetical protein